MYLNVIKPVLYSTAPLRALKPFHIKGRRIFLPGTAALLHIAKVKAKRQGSIHYLFIFLGSQPAIYLRMLGGMEKGSVLA